ncbi:HIT family protein [Acidipropionibacterium timonense]|uniref:HIT family protein n=1 Tax=Acidipropionibacterium timonense TaxID=2161818 RepID=UPI00102F836B|nr:HIT domain-containing protein [Acidipropionibacterium timonense]
MDCLFCSIIAGDIPCRQVASDDVAIAFLDVNPAQDGHTLVVPRVHVPDVLANDGQLAAVAPLVTTVARTLVDRLDADGVNLLVNSGEVAGQSVGHLHVHVIPRYAREPGVAGIRTRLPLRDQDEVLGQLVG